MKMRAHLLFVFVAICIARCCAAQNKINVIRGDAPKESAVPAENRRQLAVELENTVRTLTGNSERLAVHSSGRAGLRVVVLGKVRKDQMGTVMDAVRKRVLDTDAEHMHLIFLATVDESEIRDLIANVEKGGDLPPGVYLSLKEIFDEQSKKPEKDRDSR